jgi:ribA/ribD-fused uncharacterized protein
MRNNKIDEIIQHDDENIKGFFYEYRWLSNYHDCDIFWMGLHFKNTEAAYQASKCSEISNAKVFQTMSGLEAKKHSHTFVARRYWDKMRYNIMAQLVFQKYLIHQDLREKLLATGDMYIEETNYWDDTFWGVCNGVGENNLGKITMATREYFKNLHLI